MSLYRSTGDLINSLFCVFAVLTNLITLVHVLFDINLKFL